MMASRAKAGCLLARPLPISPARPGSLTRAAEMRNHGFSFPTPANLKDGRSHNIYAYAINIPVGVNPLIGNDFKTIQCASLVDSQPAILWLARSANTKGVWTLASNYRATGPGAACSNGHGWLNTGLVTSKVNADGSISGKSIQMNCERPWGDHQAKTQIINGNWAGINSTGYHGSPAVIQEEVMPDPGLILSPLNVIPDGQWHSIVPGCYVEPVYMNDIGPESEGKCYDAVCKTTESPCPGHNTLTDVKYIIYNSCEGLVCDGQAVPVKFYQKINSVMRVAYTLVAGCGGANILTEEQWYVKNYGGAGFDNTSPATGVPSAVDIYALDDEQSCLPFWDNACPGNDECLAVCSAGAVSGCKVCKSDGSGWGDDNSKCSSGQICQSGNCVTNQVCTPNSVSGCKVCNSTGLAWVDTDSKCAANQVCQSGTCVAACVPHASKQCSGSDLYWYDSCGVKENLVQSCGADSQTTNYKCGGNWIQRETIQQGCAAGACFTNSIWNNDTNCASSNKVCNNAVCAVPAAVCSSQCAKDAKQCSAGGYQICSDANGDGCNEWGSIIDCAANQICNNGICVVQLPSGAAISANPIASNNSAAISISNSSPAGKPFATLMAAKMTRAEILAAIAKIQALIADLQKQLLAITGGAKYSCTQITKNLYYGMKNDSQVKCLQEVLKNQGYSVTASGNYDAATKTAVAQFQQKYAAVILMPYHLVRGSGNVGTATMAKINQIVTGK